MIEYELEIVLSNSLLFGFDILLILCSIIIVLARPGLHSIVPFLIAILLGLIGIANFWLTDKGIKSRRLFLLTFIFSGVSLILPLYLDAYFLKFDNFELRYFSLTLFIASIVFILYCIFVLWKNYLNNKRVIGTTEDGI